MANDRSDRNLRLQRLLRLSDELRKLNDLLQMAAHDVSYLPVDLLARNREIVRRCDELASEMASR